MDIFARVSVAFSEAVVDANLVTSAWSGRVIAIVSSVGWGGISCSTFVFSPSSLVDWSPSVLVVGGSFVVLLIPSWWCLVSVSYGLDGRCVWERLWCYSGCNVVVSVT